MTDIETAPLATPVVPAPTTAPDALIGTAGIDGVTDSVSAAPSPLVDDVVEPAVAEEVVAVDESHGLGAHLLWTLLEDVPLNVLFSDENHIIRHFNAAARVTLGGFRGAIGVGVEDLLGTSLDVFDVWPEFHAGFVTPESELPFAAEMHFSGISLQMAVSAVYAEDGTFSGSMATWEMTTDRVKVAQEAEDNRANAEAINTVLQALATVAEPALVVRDAIAAARQAWGLPYATASQIHDDLLVCDLEAGSLGASVSAASMRNRETRGVGLSGRCWAAGDVVVVRDLDEIADSPRHAELVRAGVLSAVAVPLLVEGMVVGTMEFFATDAARWSTERLDALRSISDLVTRTIAKVDRDTQEKAAAEEAGRTIEMVLRVIREAATGDLTGRLDLDSPDPLAMELAGGLTVLLDSYRDNLTTIGRVSEQVSVASQQLTVLSQGMGEGASLTSDRAASASSASVQVSASIQTVATAAEEMTASIREIAKNASDAATVATDAVTVAS
uniref:GAF domain-containing protein n=1 Tax=Nocardioides sp. TaxID=35761 RepID=UPI0026221E79